MGRLLNGHPSREAETFAHLIDEEAHLVTCGLIVSEVLQGLRQAKSLSDIERHFREMDWLSPKEPDTYIEAAKLAAAVRACRSSASIERVDITTGERTPWHTIRPADPAGINDIVPGYVMTVYITPDGQTYAYSYRRVLSDLYVVGGLS